MKLRSLFTDEDIRIAIENAGDSNAPYMSVAEELTAYGYGDVSRQLARYWCRQFEITKKNGEPYLTLAIANRALKAKRELLIPKASDLLAIEKQSMDSRRILFFTDSHAPYQHPDLIPFLAAVAAMYNPTMIINGGDEVDNHALSFHDSDPNLFAAGHELEQSQIFLDELEGLFPDMRICESNHGSLLYRRAKAHGIPVQYLKTYRDMLFPSGGAEGWSWHDTIRIPMEHGRDLQFQHSCTGDLLKGSAHENANLYVGHEHSKFGIGYGANAVETYYSVYGGCTLDTHAMAFGYGKLFPNKPILGCVMVFNGVPHCIPMQVDKHNRWLGDV
jgi:hypothetical protein